MGASSKVTTTSSPDSTNSATTTSTPDSTNSETTKTSSPSTTTTRSPSSTTTAITTTTTSPAATQTTTKPTTTTTSPIQQTSSSVPTTSGGSTVGVVVNLTAFASDYKQRLDKVIGQCLANFRELNRTKQHFQQTIDEIQKEAEDLKIDLANATQTFEKRENMLKAQLNAKHNQLLQKEAEIKDLQAKLETCQQRSSCGGGEDDVKQIGQDDDDDDDDDDNDDDDDEEDAENGNVTWYFLRSWLF